MPPILQDGDIWSRVYTLFPSTIVPILYKEINTEKEGLMTGGGEEVREHVCVWGHIHMNSVL